MASVKVDRSLPPQEISPADIYGSEGPVRLRIATGGAGESGLLRALAEAFIKEYGTIAFQISWLASDTSLSFNALASGAADLAITYLAYAELVALRQGVADKVVYAWRDHWVFAGPKSNPAKLPTDGKSSIYEIFARLFQAAIETANDPEPVRFLSRYDKSANNIAESKIWAMVGQSPWSYPYSTWYHRYNEFPLGALRAASALGEYTLVDRGTWYSIESSVRERMTTFAEAFNATEDDPMLNPAHALVGTAAKNKEMADAFAEWLGSDNGGQKVIASFSRHGQVLYSTVPAGVDPLGRVKGFI